MLKNVRIFMSMQARSWFSIQMATDAQQADILIYDYIGFGGVTAQDFANELKSVQAKSINVRLNTPGGDVFDGLAIYNSLNSHTADIHVQVDGLAASIGSIIAMAGDTITMAESSFLMVHNPWALVIGNSKDMRDMAATLDKVGGSLAGIYAARAKATTEQAQSWMDAETWFTADEAKAAGLADVVISNKQSSEEVQGKQQFDLSGYTKVPSALTEQRHTQDQKVNEQDVRRPALMRQRLALVERGEFSLTHKEALCS